MRIKLASRRAYLAHNPEEVDTNVIEISLNCLEREGELATGEPIPCSNCECLLNTFSNVTPVEEGKFSWKCEFCGSENLIEADFEELPGTQEQTYLLESANQVAQRQQGSDDSSTLIFCIDASGSMCISTRVEGQLNLKTNRQEEMLKLLEAGDDREIDRSVTYVSRMECMQAAIEAQLHQLQKAAPSKKVGFVSFNREVNVIGDGNATEVIAGDKLSSFDSITSAVDEKHPVLFSETIENTCQRLAEKVMQMREDGPTALGPALLASVLLAAQGGPGSKVVLCTDGLANVGVGSFENPDASAFYENVTALASQHGVVVSVMSIEGEECKLEYLADIADQTGGTVLRVAPERLTEEFSNVLSGDVIATQVSVTVQLDNALAFRNEPLANLSTNRSRMMKYVGNATEHSVFSFEFGLKSPDKLAAENISIEGIETVSIQAIFSYSTLDGTRCLRSITRKQPVTKNKEVAREHADFEVLAKHMNHQTGKMMKGGKFRTGYSHAKKWQAELREQAKGDEEKMQEIDEFSEQICNNVAQQNAIEREADCDIDEEDERSRSEDEEDVRARKGRAMRRRKELTRDSMAYAGRKKFKKY